MSTWPSGVGGVDRLRRGEDVDRAAVAHRVRRSHGGEPVQERVDPVDHSIRPPPAKHDDASTVGETSCDVSRQPTDQVQVPSSLR